jgi:hypothetical protein
MRPSDAPFLKSCELSHQDDEQWERIIADPRPRPKLEAFVKEALSVGSEPLDLERL